MSATRNEESRQAEVRRLQEQARKSDEELLALREELGSGERERAEANDAETQKRADLQAEVKDLRNELQLATDALGSERDKQGGMQQVAEDLRKELQAKAKTEAEALLENARAEIGEEKDKAVKALRGEAAGLAVAIAEKLLDAEVDEAKHKQLIDKMVGKI